MRAQILNKTYYPIKGLKTIIVNHHIQPLDSVPRVKHIDSESQSGHWTMFSAQSHTEN